MAGRSKVSQRILAVDPYTRGFGFVVLEGEKTLLDWGLKEARTDKHTRCLRLVEALIEMYQPDVVVVEDMHDTSCRRCVRVRALLHALAQHAEAKQVKTCCLPRQAVHAAFFPTRATTKYEIAGAVVARLPDLAPWRPPVRKPWMSEDVRASIFDAAALALSFIHSGNKK